MIEVAAAVIRQGARFLIARRGPGDDLAGLWEFPGGKIEPGETPEECLARELREELGADAEVGRLLAQTVHRYPTKTVRLLFYEARLIGDTLHPHAHDALAWVTPQEMSACEFAPADRPFVVALGKGQASLLA